MDSVLCDAIKRRYVIQFSHNGGSRGGEPYCHGVSTARNEVLRGFQISGYSRSGFVPAWKLFRVSKIQHLKIKNENFTVRSRYRKNDSDMITIYCQV